MTDLTTSIGVAAVLEQLAEENAELAKAALKMARIIRKENPTPVTNEDALASLAEEVADVRVCIGVLEDFIGVLDTTELEKEKRSRWTKRLSQVKN